MEELTQKISKVQYVVEIQAGLKIILSLFDRIVKRNISLSPYSIKLLDENIREPHAFSPLKHGYIFAC